MAVVSYKCPCCGAGIAFDSEKQLFKCEYCLSEFTQEQLEAQTPKVDPVEEERTSKADSDEFCEKLLSYTCNNCGAEVFADADTVADFCYYCHNPVVCDGRLSGQLKPNKIIPFAFDKAEAENVSLPSRGRRNSSRKTSFPQSMRIRSAACISRSG